MDVFIVNPIANNGDSLRFLNIMQRIYESYNRKYVIVFTEKGKTTEITSFYAHNDSINNIVSIGGDGTLNEVLNGMIDSKKGLIVVPAGCGNDFYRAIENMDDDFLSDVGKVNDDYFFGILSLGIDAKVAMHANEFKDNGFKKLAYPLGIVKAFFNFDNLKVIGAFDEATINDRVTMLSLCNGMYYGRGIRLDDTASIDDGLFNVFSVSCSKGEVPKLFLKLLNNKHKDDDKITYFKSKEAHIILDEPTLYSFDGEMRYSDELKVSMYPQKVLIKKDFRDNINKIKR